MFAQLWGLFVNVNAAYKFRHRTEPYFSDKGGVNQDLRAS
jgi:hypothetical protein